METLCVRLTEAEHAVVAARADEEGVDREDLLRRALDVWISQKPGAKVKVPLAVLAEGAADVKGCEHPLSLRTQSTKGVYCDACGAWL